MITIQDGVVFRALHKEIWSIFEVLEEAFLSYGIHPTIVKASDWGIDVSVKELPTSTARVIVRNELQKELGGKYDVYEEQDRIHIEIVYKHWAVVD